MTDGSRSGRHEAPGGIELRAGEDILFQGRPAWRALLSFYASGLLLAAVVFVVLALLADESAIGVAAAAAIAGLTLLVGWVRRIFTRYLITDQRLRITRGIVKRAVQETRLERVQNVNYNQGVLDRLLRRGRRGLRHRRHGRLRVPLHLREAARESRPRRR